MIVTDGIHLMSDVYDLDELHKFAQSIGLKREVIKINRGPGIAETLWIALDSLFNPKPEEASHDQDRR